jgi:hypothetical protein
MVIMLDSKALRLHSLGRFKAWLDWGLETCHYKSYMTAADVTLNR